MQSRNPVLGRTQFSPLGAPGTLDGPPLRPMNLDDVVVRSAMLLAVVVATAGATFVLKPSFGLVVLAGIIGFGLGIFGTFSKKTRVPVMFAYAGFEGVFVGGISAMYAGAFGGNVVPQAILGTLCAFGAMLFCYKAGIIRATERFRSILLTVGLGYLAFAAIHFVGVITGMWDSLYWGADGPNPLGILLSLGGTALASLFLILDFDMIERAVAARAPEDVAWRCAFSLVITLVWLYLEMLRLVSILQGD